MRKKWLLLLCLFSLTIISAQEDKLAPFNKPQELAYSSPCLRMEDPAKCTLSELQDRFKPVLERYIKKFKKDTIAIGLRFRFNQEGETIERDVKLQIGRKSPTEKLKSEIEAVISDLSFSITDYNESKYPSSHTYKYKFLVDKASRSISGIAIENAYSGGVWGQVPLFADCPRRGDQEDRLCFQKHMQAHIKKHFNYPYAALRYGIQGKVDISFVINSQGEVTQLKMQSPSDILKKEAARIISLLPTFKPGIQNGKAVKVPYSIPIWFRLN